MWSADLPKLSPKTGKEGPKASTRHSPPSTHKAVRAGRARWRWVMHLRREDATGGSAPKATKVTCRSWRALRPSGPAVIRADGARQPNRRVRPLCDWGVIGDPRVVGVRTCLSGPPSRRRGGTLRGQSRRAPCSALTRRHLAKGSGREHPPARTATGHRVPGAAPSRPGSGSEGSEHSDGQRRDTARPGRGGWSS